MPSNSLYPRWLCRDSRKRLALCELGILFHPPTKSHHLLSAFCSSMHLDLFDERNCLVPTFLQYQCWLVIIIKHVSFGELWRFCCPRQIGQRLHHPPLEIGQWPFVDLFDKRNRLVRSILSYLRWLCRYNL